MQASGNSILVRTPTGIKMFSEGDIAKRNVTIIKDGQPAKMSDFHQGDKLTATIVTEGHAKGPLEARRWTRCSAERRSAGSSTESSGRGASAEASGRPRGQPRRGGARPPARHVSGSAASSGGREEAAENRKLSAAVGGSGRSVPYAWRDADGRAAANAVVGRPFMGCAIGRRGEASICSLRLTGPLT
jgi:hypothetical protein